PNPVLHGQTRHPLSSTLLPYTTLFRSRTSRSTVTDGANRADDQGVTGAFTPPGGVPPQGAFRRGGYRALASGVTGPQTCSSSSRSEEHTSELQSRFDLVCRLLLEKNHR